jgi:hypothetical protein
MGSHEFAGEAPLDLASQAQKLDQPGAEQVEGDAGHRLHRLEHRASTISRGIFLSQLAHDEEAAGSHDVAGAPFLPFRRLVCFSFV